MALKVSLLFRVGMSVWLEKTMLRSGFVLLLLLVLSSIVVLSCAFETQSRDEKGQQSASPPNDTAVELAETRRQLKQALGLLVECFGGSVNLENIQTASVTITAYSSTRDQCDSTPHITASQKPVRVGSLAVSRDLLKEMGISYGQRVLIPGYGMFEVLDTMHPRWQRRVDIWESDREAALLFGRQEGTLIWVGEKKESV